MEKILRLPLGSDGSATEVGSGVPHRRTNPAEPEYDQKRKPRNTVKPYQVLQHKRSSFTVKAHLIEWEKLGFRVGFNWREGMTIHNVRFLDRNSFNLLSLSEIFVPYGDPRNPIYRKSAFEYVILGHL